MLEFHKIWTIRKNVTDIGDKIAVKAGEGNDSSYTSGSGTSIWNTFFVKTIGIDLRGLKRSDLVTQFGLK